MASRRSLPHEFKGRNADAVYSTLGAFVVPESGAEIDCAVGVLVGGMGQGGLQVIVTVVRGEHQVVVVAESIITGVTRVPGHMKGVVGLFRLHLERTVLGVVPAEVDTTCLQVKSQLVAACQCQLMK